LEAEKFVPKPVPKVARPGLRGPHGGPAHAFKIRQRDVVVLPPAGAERHGIGGSDGLTVSVVEVPLNHH
jgi:hypothetical protein